MLPFPSPKFSQTRDQIRVSLVSYTGKFFNTALSVTSTLKENLNLVILQYASEINISLQSQYTLELKFRYTHSGEIKTSHNRSWSIDERGYKIVTSKC